MKATGHFTMLPLSYFALHFGIYQTESYFQKSYQYTPTDSTGLFPLALRAYTLSARKFSSDDTTPVKGEGGD